MTDSSIDKKGPRAGLLLLLATLVVSGIVYAVQRDLDNEFEGTYPDVVPMIEGEFHFTKDMVEITLSRRSGGKQLIVFAYDRKGRQVAIMKPIHNRRVFIKPGDTADYRADIKNGQVTGFKIFRKSRGFHEAEDFFESLVKAREAKRLYGVQECLYPICSMCMDVCPVIENGVILMNVKEDGRIHPKINYGGCPRCGKCFALCKMGVIFETDLRHAIKPDFLLEAEAEREKAEKEKSGGSGKKLE